MKINHIDVNNLKIFDRLLPEEIFNVISLNDLQSIVSHCKELVLYGKKIKQKLDRLGFVIIKLCNLTDLDENQTNNLFLLFCLSVGDPTEHNLNKHDYIWEIKPRQNISYTSTFSEHNLEASLHTDTQYHLNPEKYIALLTIKQAMCGGGKTILLDFYEVLKTLQKTNEGINCLKILKTYSFPFAIPTVFAEDKLNQEVIYSHIISNDFTIRYRYDTIYKGLRIANIPQTDIRYWALYFFENHLVQHPQQKLFYLPENHIIFINNYRFLHGRTSFQDTSRYLLRVRLN
jgi:alpha-ketoglutarate-dependent taurine dioxygenase